MGEEAGYETMELSSLTVAEQEEHAARLRQYEITRLAQSAVVPTSDEEVKQLLRSFNQPIILFGEKPNDRRFRLKTLVAEKQLNGQEDQQTTNEISKLISSQYQTKQSSVAINQTDAKDEESGADLVFYTEATKELIKARELIAKVSWIKAQSRIDKVRTRKRPRSNDEGDFAALCATEERTGSLCQVAREVDLKASQFGDTRPLTCCKFSSSGKLLGTSSAGEIVAIWDANPNSCNKLFNCSGHTGRVFDIDFSANEPTVRQPLLVASASFDQTSLIWNVSNENFADKDVKAVTKLMGHKNRLSKVRMHPTGEFVATSSFDHSWRLWSVETGKELLLQDSHEAPVYGLAFHPDGSLLASGDMDGLCALWDMRSGRCISSFRHHARGLISAAFSPVGYLLATSSEDHSVRIYDLRLLKQSKKTKQTNRKSYGSERESCLYMLPAHNGLVSSVKFDGEYGELLVSSGYDGLSKIWSVREGFECLKVLRGHEGKVSEADIFVDQQHEQHVTVATCGYDDKTWKLWS